MYLSGEEVDTLYIGGGTPSVLSIEELTDILDVAYMHYKIVKNAEITLEVNPDDVSITYLNSVRKHTPVNRLSMGVQSFNDNDLKFLNRRHTGKDALKSVHDAYNKGFENITIDLMYGIPGSSRRILENNLKKTLKLNIPHVSAYHLSIEPKTVFAYYRKKGKIKPVNEKISKEQFHMVAQLLEKEGFIHYEISNFSKPGFISKHNTNYWTGGKYLGVGPSAHSYDQHSRQWNTKNHNEYIQAIDKGTDKYFEKEELDLTAKFNDIIITRLRTFWGIDLRWIKKEFPSRYCACLDKGVQQFVKSGDMIYDKDNIILTKQGMLRSDYIFSKLVFIT